MNSKTETCKEKHEANPEFPEGGGGTSQQFLPGDGKVISLFNRDGVILLLKPVKYVNHLACQKI